MHAEISRNIINCKEIAMTEQCFLCNIGEIEIFTATMCVYIYVCVCVCVYIYIYICTFIPMYMQVYNVCN